VPAADALTGLSAALAAARTGNDTARTALATARAAVDTAGRDADSAARRRTAIQAEQGDWQRRIAASAGQRSELANRREAAEDERAGLAARTRAIAADLAGLASTTQTADAARAAAADRLAAAESALNAVSARARAADADVGEARELRATARAEAEHQDAARLDLERLCGERFQCPPPLLPGRFGFGIEPGDPAALAESLDALTAERDRLGPVNLRADIELKELEEQALLTASEKAELDTAIARLRGSIGSLNREGRQRLQAAFTAVDGHFRTLFSDLFGGGEAQLALIESDDPLEAGLEIMAQPPGKKLQSLTLLSGGEQALTATALIFALFLSNPAPICVLDEVDAPLDDANVERFCDLLDRMAAETATRFLIVTHNAVSMSRMHRLFGVTMGEPGVSQLVSVDLQTAERLVAMA
jgi:chromosome segregation protein